jgi:hypothetical protein
LSIEKCSIGTIEPLSVLVFGCDHAETLASRNLQEEIDRHLTTITTDENASRTWQKSDSGEGRTASRAGKTGPRAVWQYMGRSGQATTMCRRQSGRHTPLETSASFCGCYLISNGEACRECSPSGAHRLAQAIPAVRRTVDLQEDMGITTRQCVYGTRIRSTLRIVLHIPVRRLRTVLVCTRSNDTLAPVARTRRRSWPPCLPHWCTVSAGCTIQNRKRPVCICMYST